MEEDTNDFGDYLAWRKIVSPEDDNYSEDNWQALVGSAKVLEKANPAETFLRSLEEGDQDQESTIRRREHSAFFWLMNRGISHFSSSMEIITKIREGEKFYRLKMIRKKKGDKIRMLNVPDKRLKKIQKKINQKLLSDLPHLPYVNGFSGGSVQNALRPHIGFKSFIKMDVVNAFPSINRQAVMTALSQKELGQKYGLFSWYVANILCDFCTLEGGLPQGAPTSPRLFDLVFAPIDQKLRKILDEAGGLYTRYADNLFFSFPKKYFPQVLITQIKSTVQKGNTDLVLQFHKFWMTNRIDVSLRALGLNIKDGKLQNTRTYKRRLRKQLHHFKRVVELGLDDDIRVRALGRLSGFYGFVVKETLPQKLKDSYADLKTFFTETI